VQPIRVTRSYVASEAVQPKAPSAPAAPVAAARRRAMTAGGTAGSQEDVAAAADGGVPVLSDATLHSCCSARKICRAGASMQLHA